MAQRRIILPVLALLAAGAALWSCAPPLLDAFVASTGLRGSRTQQISNREASRLTLAARGGDDEEAASVEVGGFSGFVVGLAFLPYVCYALYSAFGILTRNETFVLGPYGLEAISIAVSIGLVLWSLGSFLQRGKGLPAGPLGLLGLSEGLSYLAALLLAVASVSTSFKTGGGSMPSMPKIEAPKFEAPKGLPAAPSIPAAPSFSMPKVPDFKAPDFKVPEVKMPDVKMPDVKVPDVKLPDVKLPDVKPPDVKPPETKKEEPKKEETKAPEAAKPAPPPAPAKPPPPPPPKPAPAPPKVEPPAAKKAEKPVDYGDLFD